MTLLRFIQVRWTKSCCIWNIPILSVISRSTAVDYEVWTVIEVSLDNTLSLFDGLLWIRVIFVCWKSWYVNETIQIPGKTSALPMVISVNTHYLVTIALCLPPRLSTRILLHFLTCPPRRKVSFTTLFGYTIECIHSAMTTPPHINNNEDIWGCPEVTQFHNA